MVFEGLFARARNGDRAAEALTHAQPTMVRPTIGLALGGGAARGFAHIGVIRTLEAHGIVPDVIVGTSIGAVVGGCYAAKEMDNLESWARTLTVRGVLGYLDISLSGSGLIGGGHLAARPARWHAEPRLPHAAWARWTCDCSAFAPPCAVNPE